MPLRFDKAARDEWLGLGRRADVLAEPAQHNPDLLAPPTNRNPQTLSCTHCGAGLAPFVVEHRLNCPHCGHAQEPVRWEGVMGSRTATPVFPSQHSPVPMQQEHVHPNDRQPPAWGAIQSCGNCGHAMSTFEGQRGAVCSNCGNEEPIMSTRANVHSADVSMPPEGAPVPQKETALPYNPSAYEGEIEGMHPAAQYTYQRAVAQGAAPQAAMAAAQEKQGEMMKRTQEGQNTEGIQIPVVNSSTNVVTAGGSFMLTLQGLRQQYEDLMRQGRSEEAHQALEQHDRMLENAQVQRGISPQHAMSGFVSRSTIKRVSHLLS